jgi:hypothetical protein
VTASPRPDRPRRSRCRARAFPASAVAITLLSLCAVPRAQDDPVITEARVRELVSWIAADERMGRDCPSPGLEATAVWLQERFAAAGLQPPTPDQWRHRYTLPGQRLDSRKVQISVTIGSGADQKKIALAGDADVRVLGAPAVASGSDDNAALVRAADPRLRRSLGMGGGRRATLLEVPADHPLWQACAGEREILSRRLRGSAPVFLVRAGALPAAAPAGGDDDAPPACALSWQGAESETVDVALVNVVGVLRGSTKPDEYVMVSAHYDHIGIVPPVAGDSICNGADDDASGTTAVVMLAEALSKGAPLKRSIAFVAFSAEEKGLRGSRAFAENPPLPLAAIVADVNIEMIGRPNAEYERKAWITGSSYSDFATIAGPALARAGIGLADPDMAVHYFEQSDNLSLAVKGVVAHSISAGALPLQPDYHQPSDEVAKLDIAHMTAVIRGLREVVVAFADRDERPAYNDAGKAHLERLQDRGR